MSSRLPTGHYPVAALLAVPGRWRAEVRRPGGGAPVVVDFQVGQVPGAGPEVWQGGGGWPSVSPLRFCCWPPRADCWRAPRCSQAGGAVGVVRARRPGAWPHLPGISGTVCLALGAFLLGSALAAGARLSAVPPAVLPAVNPVAPTGASVGPGS